MSAASRWHTRRSSPSLDDERIDLPGIKLQNESRAETDEQGRFVIERIVPGEASVYWQPNGGGERKTPDRYYQPAFRTVGPGETVHVDLIQEGGRPLVGKVVTNDRPEVQLDLAGAVPSSAGGRPKSPIHLACPRRIGASGSAAGASPRQAVNIDMHAEASGMGSNSSRMERSGSMKCNPAPINCTFASKGLQSWSAISKSPSRTRAGTAHRSTSVR